MEWMQNPLAGGPICAIRFLNKKNFSLISTPCLRAFHALWTAGFTVSLAVFLSLSRKRRILICSALHLKCNKMLRKREYLFKLPTVLHLKHVWKCSSSSCFWRNVHRDRSFTALMVVITAFLLTSCSGFRIHLWIYIHHIWIPRKGTILSPREF